MVNRFKLFALFLGICSILLLACNGNNLYEQSLDVDQSGWLYEDSLQFEFNIEDTIQSYDLILEVEHDYEFQYQNLYTRISTKFPDGKTHAEVRSIELAEYTGLWKGDCNSHDCSLSTKLQANTRFKNKGLHSLSFAQYNRDDALKGILGLRIVLRQHVE